MKAKFYLTAALLLSASFVFAGKGNTGGDDKSSSFAYEIQDSDAGSITLVFSADPNKLTDISEIRVTGSGTIGAYSIDKTEGTISVTIHYGPVEPTGTGRENDGGVIEIVGIDNISGVAVGNDETSTQQTLRPVSGLNDLNGSGGNSNSDAGNVTYSSVKVDFKINESNKSNPEKGGNGGIANGGGSNSPTTKGDVTVFPNPVVDQTQVVTVGEILLRTGQVVDLAGKKQLDFQFSGDVNSALIDMSGLVSGIYFISLQTSDGQTIVKRVKKL